MNLFKLNIKNKQNDEPQVDALQSEIAELRKTMESERAEMENKGDIQLMKLKRK